MYWILIRENWTRWKGNQLFSQEPSGGDFYILIKGSVSLQSMWSEEYVWFELHSMCRENSLFFFSVAL
jgi:hypothetical protein